MCVFHFSTMDEKTQDKQIPVEKDNEKIKLTKNSKGYNWEISILEINIERLKEIDKQLNEAFGEKRVFEE